MIRIFDLAWKDLLQNLREKQTFVFLLIMPVIFTLLFGFAFGGSGGPSSDPRLPVGLLDLDNSPLSQSLLKLLESSDVIRLDIKPGRSSADLEKLVADNKLAAALVIPTGYGDRFQAGNPLKLTVFADIANSAGSTAQGVIQTAANRMSISLLSAQVVAQSLGSASGLDEAIRAKTLAAWIKPPISVESTGPAASLKNKDNAFAQTSPAMMAQFAIAGLLGSAQIIVNERRTRCLQRLRTTAISHFQILMGHFLAMYVLILAQIGILIVFGQIFLKLDYLGQPVAILLMALALALFVAGLGLLIGALARSEDQAVIFALIPMFVFSAMGGAWMPLEFTGKTFQAIGHLSPVAWAMDGFKNIIARGLGLESVLVPAAVLVGYAVIFFGLAVWRFRFDE
jgi:ABC-2 type transport system permease protein